MTQKRGEGRRAPPPDLERFDFGADEVFEISAAIATAGDEIAVELRHDRPWAASQIGRATLSVPANVAEAQGEHSPGDKARFYRYARRSATESAGLIVVLGRRALVSLEKEVALRRLLLSVIKALTRRIIHFEGVARARSRGWRERRY